ncbi:lipase family protein [Crocosphaera sp. Alani8]|uniref:lipase family protein n=1 Tax=Crocosphaera sp. Alani8 TaxID=3038952 RepID=UPI00313D44FC
MSDLGLYLSQSIDWLSPNLTVNLQIKNFPKSQINTIIKVDENNQCQWIAIRGTDNLENWILDFDYIEHRFDTREPNKDPLIMNFHSGFYKGTIGIYEDIISNQNLSPSYATHITGHSLGGAVAAILMILLYHDGYSIDQCVTFGQPKVTDAKGAKRCEDLPLLRIIDEKDIVPSLPPNTLLNLTKGKYEHFASEIILHSGYYDYHLHHQAFRATDSFWSHLWQAISLDDVSSFPSNIEDHYMSNYLLNLLSNMENSDFQLKSILEK